MANHVLLNNVDHHDLKVITDQTPATVDSRGAVPTFPTEFADIQREYPILLRRDAQKGEFQAVALLGLRADENLFLDDDGWHAGYIPGVVARGPFLIGFQEQEVGGDLRREPVIHVDMDSPRVSRTEGEPLFQAHGGNTPYLERIAAILQGIHEGMAASRAMYSALDDSGLIAPVNINVEIHRDEQVDLRGYHTIDEEKLAALNGAALEKLNRAGYLQGAFLMAASIGNITRLIEKKRRRILAQAGAAETSPAGGA